MGLLRSPEPFIFASYKHVVPPGPRHFTFSNTLLPHYLLEGSLILKQNRSATAEVMRDREVM